METIEPRIGALKADREHGATFLTLEAVRTLGDAAAACEDTADWPTYLSDIARRLAEAQPSMAPVKNATARLLGRLVEAGPAGGRLRARRLAEELADNLQAAAEAAASIAAGLIPPEAAVATCSYGSAVVRTARHARDAGKTFSVLVLESSLQTDSMGARLARDLNTSGIRVKLIGDAASRDLTEHANIAIVGADAVTPTSLVNGVPTLALAQASSGRFPMYVIGETVKFICDAPVEPGYERVPMELITGIATEHGVVEPAQIERWIPRERDGPA